MIRLKKLLEELEQPVSLRDQVSKWVESNKKKLENLLEDGDIDEFYELGFEKFPEADQDDIAQFMNDCAKMHDWFEDEPVSEMPDEKELEDMVFGDKSQQKGIKMGDYDKKMKSPKESSTDLVVGDLKKLKTESKKKVEEAGQRLDPSCWDGYKIGSPKTKISPRTGKRVNNCVKEETEELEEAEYRGRKVKLGKPFYTPGGPRKRAVYVKNDKGNVVKVSFGDPNMRIKKSDPGRRKSFRARHNCDNPGPRWKARYWSCRAW